MAEPIVLTGEQLVLLHDVVKTYAAKVRGDFAPLLARVGAGNPDELKTYLEDLSKLRNEIQSAINSIGGSPSSRGPISSTGAPLLRNAIIARRRDIADRVASRSEMTIDPGLRRQLDDELLPYVALMQERWFREAAVRSAPLLTDFFPLELIEPQAEGREYDEKFHILQSPRSFLRDLVAARRAAALRDLSLAVAFVDIDNFKGFNTQRGEPYIDRYVLPTFMRCIEAHVYMRGYAYRYAGDEYVLLIKHATADEAIELAQRVRNGVAALTYEGIDVPTTVSIGVVAVAPDCHLTGQEILTAAAAAKDHAKANGRNCVACYSTPRFEADGLRIHR